MKVVDAGVFIEAILGTVDPGPLGADELVAPDLVDTEVVSALRGLARRGEVSEAQARDALDVFASLTFDRAPAAPLRRRMWALRHNLTAYDATYVALAESVDASSLITTDRRIAAAPGVRCHVEVI